MSQKSITQNQQKTLDDSEKACNALTIFIHQFDAGREKEASYAARELDRFLSLRNYRLVPAKLLEGIQ